MKTKMIILPSIFGIIAVLVILGAFNLIAHNGDAFGTPDPDFFSFFVPIATIIAFVFQFFITLPFWEKIKSQKKVWGLTHIQFIGIISLLSGFIFGLIYWETNLGIIELIFNSLIGFIAFNIYWFVNLLTLRKLDK